MDVPEAFDDELEFDGPEEEIDEIPPSMYSEALNGPFTRCIDCNGELFGTGLPYAIEKVWRDGEVVFEYAICTPCASTLFREYSEESREAIERYLEESPLDFESAGDGSACDRCGGKGEEFEREHSSMGLFIDRELLTGVTSLCSPCAEGVESVLSQKTREINGDFVERNFPGVPAGIELPLGLFG